MIITNNNFPTSLGLSQYLFLEYLQGNLLRDTNWLDYIPLKCINILNLESWEETIWFIIFLLWIKP